MTQNVVSYCRLNTSTPKEIIYKVVGEEIVKQIHDKALEELRGERRSKVEEVIKYVKEAENADNMIRSKMRRTMLRRILSPVEMAWAFPYACAVEWSKLAWEILGDGIENVLEFCVRHKLLEKCEQSD